MNMTRTALLGALVLGLLATQIVLFRRVSLMQKQVAELERRRVPSRPAPPAPRPPEEPVAAVALDPAPPARSSLTREPAVSAEREAAVPAAPGAPLAAGDVESIVNRVLEEREKNSPFGRVVAMNLEDPMEVMKRELGLSPAQAMSVEGYRKGRRLALEELQKSGLMTNDARAWKDQTRAIQNNYEAMVRSELSAEQQKKYDELKKSGKLVDLGSGAGVSISIGMPGQAENGR